MKETQLNTPTKAIIISLLIILVLLITAVLYSSSDMEAMEIENITTNATNAEQTQINTTDEPEEVEVVEVTAIEENTSVTVTTTELSSFNITKAERKAPELLKNSECYGYDFGMTAFRERIYKEYSYKTNQPDKRVDGYQIQCASLTCEGIVEYTISIRSSVNRLDETVFLDVTINTETGDVTCETDFILDQQKYLDILIPAQQSERETTN